MASLSTILDRYHTLSNVIQKLGLFGDLDIAYTKSHKYRLYPAHRIENLPHTPQKPEPEETMADRPGTHRANIIVDANVESFRNVTRDALNQQVQAVMADLEVAYQARVHDNAQAHGVQISVNINYSLRPLTSQADLDDQTARRSRADMAHETAQLNLDIGVNAGEINQQDTDDFLDDEYPPTLFSSAARLLDSLPVVNLADLIEESQDCPVCREPFSGSEYSEADTPVLLHCNHIVGRGCVEKWLSGDHNSCPMCRAAIFEPAVLTALANQEGLRDRSGSLYHVQVGNFAREDTDGQARPGRNGDHAVGDDTEVALPEAQVLTVLANEEQLDTGGSEPHNPHEVEM